ncbi:ABC transporter permease [Nocardioides anomalus]|uniref:ABC transporter permease n=1 Tax=Nocardioides anomalus TaxID=2712223 RepID=A0A6G6W9R9_9ACTN|nr:ABC transporter permease [Nocardioides anomalus]QIG41966.1 ABC transporter permease [Nocardioides anomalus]
MSTATANPSIDTTNTPGVPLLRLAQVEARKALDTRAGRWLIISILALIVVVEVIYSFAASDDLKNLDDYLQIPGAIFGFFLPIIVIMLVTSEASQRNGLVTFTLEPRRSRVVLAKFIAGVALGIGVMVLGFVLALLGTVLGMVTGASPEWSVTGDMLFSALFLANLIGIFTGFAIAMLIMNTPGAIVGYFAYSLILPTAVGILSALSSTFDDIAPWIEFNTAQTPLISGDYAPTGEQWAQILTAGIIWLVVPLALGIWRLLRIEFK